MGRCSCNLLAAVLALFISLLSGRADERVHVAVAADLRNLRILRALLASTAANSRGAFVHVIHAEDGARMCEDLLQDVPSNTARCVLWPEPRISEVSSMIRVVSGQNSSACVGLEGCNLSRAKRLSNSFNFARFFLSDILPGLDRVIWMDCDVIVTSDMNSIWDQGARSADEALLSAFPEPGRFGRFYLEKDRLSQLISERSQGVSVDMEADSFNDGVIMINLKRWRDLGVSASLKWLMRQHVASTDGLWKYGTQPIMMLLGTAFGWKRLPANQCYGDLGFRTAEPQRVQESVFLHFNGERKPWSPDGINKDLWEPYFTAQRWESGMEITL